MACHSTCLPPKKAFRVWSRYEAFPRFMARVREVRRVDGDRWRWTVAGPGGVPVTWETEVTRPVPDPPGGAVGHGLAAVLGADPKQAMDEDLVRLKSMLEQGKTRAHGERVTREEIGRDRCRR